MLLRFAVSNHRSIRDRQEMTLVASKRIKRPRLTVPVSVVRESVLPIAAIFGPNASGKSAFIDAMDEMQRLIVRSHVRFGTKDDIPRYPFALGQPDDETPTCLECSFTLPPDSAASPESVYEYGFEYTNKEFRREWLYEVTRRDRQSTHLLFDRSTDNGRVSVQPGNRLRGENRTIAKLTRPNSLFLSCAAQNNHPQMSEIFQFFNSHWDVHLASNDPSPYVAARRLAEFPHMDQLVHLVRQADLGVVDVSIEDEPDELPTEVFQDVFSVLRRHMDDTDVPETLPESAIRKLKENQKRIRLMHTSSSGGSRALDYWVESRGTRTLITLLVPALKALASGSLLAIDELDTSLHPSLSQAFVSLFSRSESNPHGAQLLFSSHDVSLLGSSLIQPDELWLAEKDDEGVSSFVPVTEFSWRSRDDLERAYREGRFGGLPPSDDFVLNFATDLGLS